MQQQSDAAEVVGQATADVIGRALVAWVHGPFVEDFEFATVTGLSRDDAARVASAWPRIDNSEEADQAVRSALGNLIGYPHGLSLEKEAGLTDEQLRDARERWIASTLTR